MSMLSSTRCEDIKGDLVENAGCDILDCDSVEGTARTSMSERAATTAKWRSPNLRASETQFLLLPIHHDFHSCGTMRE